MPIQDNFRQLVRVLQQNSQEFAPIIPFGLHAPQVLVFDLSASNKVLNRIDFTDHETFNAYIFGEMQKAGTPVGIGKYQEDRIIYRQSANFQGIEARTIHLGIDIWAQAGTAVYCPLKGTIHSFGNNTGFGNYGPTLVIQHILDGITFYTLYGHLNVESLDKAKTGKPIEIGEKIGEFGKISENGGWPPHLHFQIIADMQTWHGDFPGVAARSQKEYYLMLCPDPNLILQIRKLETG